MTTSRPSSPKKRQTQLQSPDNAPSQSSAGRMDPVFQALLNPFRHRKDSSKIFSDLAPAMMTPQIMSHAATVSSHSNYIKNAGRSTADFATIARAPLRLTASRRVTSRDLQIVEAANELLEAEVPEPEGVASNVSLLRGFNATIPSAEKGKSRRRQTRNVDTLTLGLKKLGLDARGLLAEDEHESQSVVSEEDVVLVNEITPKAKRKPRQSLATTKTLGKEELKRQRSEILKDKENIQVKRTLMNNEIAEITTKIEAFDAIRVKLEQDLLKLQEEELELDDELEGVRERMDFESSSNKSQTSSGHHLPPSSRRRRGPAFLPSEHHELPPGVAFMTLSSHSTPITSLDFSEPYGTLVSAAQEDSQPRVWDLLSGQEIGRLRGHTGTVKCLQVEDHVCLTGSDDSTIRLWDLRRVEEEDVEIVVYSDAIGSDSGDGEMVERPNGIRNDSVAGSERGRETAFVRALEGHSKAVTAMYFEDDCLVTGASDKTMRQWDLTTGQCVMTMDILWAISHPPTVPSPGLSGSFFPGTAASIGTFAVPTPPYADGTWEMYQDFVGAVQFWGYALVSGSGDGAVRLWDMRTGQPHRTLLGHTAPVTCLQFDETHVVTGSLDKSLRIWDLRSGGIFETLKYDRAVTGLQFDSRKIVAATGENAIKIYNRTTMQHSSLLTNGHTRPVERIRYMDRYLASGGRDATVKIWAL
ncbi:WD40 repeat-like protein [Thelephora ganbajun]|uniref:WD40 repeat-like protein n=1 Tax=Thelephora ganbajun TaxID=370292 RepID=A0ACB6ZX97_THEGA|nr:WD40 repeat-like protein [Thelephora ganbajun]